MEKQVCAEGLMFKQLEKFYGTLEPEALAERLSTLELPEDKYDAAVATVLAQKNAQTDEEIFVDRFLWGMNEMEV